MNTSTHISKTRRSALPLIGAVVFLVCYLVMSPISGAVSSSELPLPGASATEVYGYYTNNDAGAVLTGIVGSLSILGLLFVVCSLRIRLQSLGLVAGWVAFASFALSSVLSLVLGAMASTVDSGMVMLLRNLSFYTGGVVHVTALGVLVLSIATTRTWSRPVRIVSWIAGVLAVLSLLSLAFYYASVFLPVGRVLCMIALVVVGVSVLRQGRRDAASGAPAS